MEAGDMILVVAVIVSLVIGILSLRQTKNIQDKQIRHVEETRLKEHRQKLINEIIAWATEVGKCGLGRDFSIIGMADAKNPLLYFSNYIADLAAAYEAINVRSRYIQSVTSNFKHGLKNDTDELVIKLKSHIEFLDGLSATDISKWEEIVKRIGESRRQLAESSFKLIEEATKIKTEEASSTQQNSIPVGTDRSEVYEQPDSMLRKYLIAQVPVYFFASFLFIQLISFSQRVWYRPLPFLDFQIRYLQSWVYILLAALLLAWAIALCIIACFIKSQRILAGIERRMTLPYWFISLIVFGYALFTGLVSVIEAVLSEWYFFAFAISAIILLLLFLVHFIQSLKSNLGIKRYKIRDKQ